MMGMQIENHWLQPARRLLSPNCNERPGTADIKLLVIHAISLPPGCFGEDYISDLFANRLDPQCHPYFEEVAGLQVSSHLLIDRQGSVTQYVPFNGRAWHAGESCFQGEENCNDFSIGIELEGCDDQPFEQIQYQQLAAVTRALMDVYPGINQHRIVGHSDIAPGRKTDPGPCFDWQYYFALLNDQTQERINE